MISLEFEAYEPRTQCVIALIAALSVLERKVGKANPNYAPTLTWESFIGLAHQEPPIRGALRRGKQGPRRFLDDYFAPPGQTLVGFGGRSKGVTPKIAQLVSKVISRYLASDTPLDAARKGDGKPSTLSVLIAKISAFADPTHLGSILDKVNPEQTGRGACVERFLDLAFGETPEGLKHPEFPALSLFDPKALKIEHHGLFGTEDRANWGLLAVIREARGWAAQKQKDVNLLVRDILWLAPEGQRREDFFGFYASTLDRDAFVLDDFQLEDETIVTRGRLRRPGKRAQRNKILFADFETSHPFQLRYAIIAGATGEWGDPIFAGWKALIVRPKWKDIKLDALLYQMGPEDAAVTADILSHQNVCGVLFSNELRAAKADLQKRREIFRELLANDESLVSEPVISFSAFLGEALRERLDNLLFDIARERSASAPNLFGDNPNETIERIVDDLEKFVQEKWHLVEPAQIILYKKLPQTRVLNDVDQATREKLAVLLDRTDVGQYAR